MTEQAKLSPKQSFVALVKVARQVYRAAPFAVILKTIGSIIDAVLPLATAWFAAQATTALADAYLAKPGAGQRAVVYVLLAAGVGIFNLVWNSAVSYMNEVARVRIANTMVESLVDQFTHLDFWRYDDKNTADMYDKAESFTYYASNVFDDAMRIVTNVAQFVISLVALVFVQWWFGVILLVGVVPSALIQRKISLMQTQYWHGNVSKRRTANDIRWNVFQPANLAETRLYGVIGHLTAMYRELRNIDNVARLSVERKYVAGRIAASLFEALGQLAIEVLTIIRIIAQAWPIGQYVYVQQLVSRASGSVSSLMSIANTIDEQLASLYQYESFMTLPRVDDQADRPIVFPQKIRFENVSFTYPFGSDQVLKHISFEISAKQHIAIVGENGAGKSTLIKLLAGLYAPTKGAVMLDTTNLQEIPAKSWHAQMSMLHQDFIHYWFATVKENIWFGDVSKPFDEKRYDEAVKAAGAGAFIAKLQKGRDTVLNKWTNNDDDTPGTELSGGQWQRIALARNFYRDSPLVVLDEPTSAIDALAEARIFNHLFHETDRTIITVSHRLSTIKKADVIIMLKDGELVEQGAYSQLIAKKGEFYKMFQVQIED